MNAAIAVARSPAVCSAHPRSEKLRKPAGPLALQRRSAVPRTNILKPKGVLIRKSAAGRVSYPETLFKPCHHQSPMDLRQRRTPVTAIASAAAAVPLSPSPQASPLHRFVQAGLTTVSKGFDVTACFVKWCAAIQIFLLKHPNFLTKLVLALFYLRDAIVTVLDKDPEQATLATRKLKYLGPNFPVYSGVMVGDINMVKRLILGPQKRGPYIAWGRSVAKAFPANMLLFMSDKAAGGTGEREQIKALLMDLFTSEAVLARGKDEVARSLVAAFAKEVKGGKPDTLSFCTAYVLYVVFGVTPDKATTELVTKGIGPYSIFRISPIGIFKRGLSDGEKKVRAFLAQTPLVTGADLKGYDREKFLDALMPVLHIAAIPGPATFISYATTLLPSSFKFNYGSEEANLNAMYEAMRAHPPVASVSSYLQQPTEIEIDGKKHTFPTGTKVMYHIKTANKDPSVHADALTVDVTRPNLAAHVLNFASFGPENNGRQCPGRLVAERLGIDLFKNLGNVEFRTSNP